MTLKYWNKSFDKKFTISVLHSNISLLLRIFHCRFRTDNSKITSYNVNYAISSLVLDSRAKLNISIKIKYSEFYNESAKKQQFWESKIYADDIVHLVAEAHFIKNIFERKYCDLNDGQFSAKKFEIYAKII